MITKHYKNAVPAVLEEFMPSAGFRTVLFQQSKKTGGVDEISVEVELKDKFMKTLSFPVPWDGKLYGYIRKNKLLTDITKTKKITMISLHDWDNNFLMLIERAEEKEEVPFLVTNEEVKNLLENCLRVPQQRYE